VLELARRIRLGVDVRDFLQLERAFERDRVMHAAAEKERVLALGEALCPRNDLRLERQHRAERRRQVAQGFQVLFLVLRLEAPAQLGEGQREQEKAGELRGE